MKKMLIISSILITLFAFKANSQDYETICKVGSSSWNYIPYGGCDFFYTDSITILKDTIYNEQNYFLLYSFGYFESDTAGYLREDTIVGKLWYRENLSTAPEYLIMDLSLNKNDSFMLHEYSYPTEITVDTVYYDDENRKHVGFSDEIIRICSFTPDFEFIEGVGSTACHFYQGTSSGPYLSTSLLCCHRNNELIFSNEEFYNNCNLLCVNAHISNTDSEVNVFPNPSNGCFEIKFDNPNCEFFIFEIYSLTGQTVYSEKTNNDLINIKSGLNGSGIYFYTLTNNKNKMINGKILIEITNHVW
ncbi:MAG TPA: T9SS type A sorting domain-containing protein [Bacteroidales bacterium]|nr:T9SS type A sorting domain-containing protein [Bacteroidales bacterium]